MSNKTGYGSIMDGSEYLSWEQLQERFEQASKESQDAEGDPATGARIMVRHKPDNAPKAQKAASAGVAAIFKLFGL